jgi:S-adenosylmethionine:tRNA ribosyltransferase-isomerase
MTSNPPKTHPSPPSGKNPNNLFDLNSYGYELPEELIAQFPLSKRDDAKLMVINRKNGTITHDIFSNLNKHLPLSSLFIVNNSKVIPARLLGRKQKTGGEVEIFLLKALSDGYSFEALLRPLKKIREGEPLEFGEGIEATLVDRERRIVRFNKANLIEHLRNVGHIPLPPYIKREDQASDHDDYQTVYAKDAGSVAAPTAGLHSSPY